MGNISIHKFSGDIFWREAERYIVNVFDGVLNKSPEDLLPRAGGLPRTTLGSGQAASFTLYRKVQGALEGRVYGVKKKTVVFLSGGSTIKNLKFRIKNLEFRDSISFAQIDERFLPESREDINAFQIGRTGLWEACREKGIPYYVVSQEGSLEEAAGDYNDKVSKLFQQSDERIAILGIGEDGHTAGLLPGYQKLWDIDKYVVGYNTSHHPRSPFLLRQGFGGQVGHLGGGTYAGKFPQRISLTPKALKQMDVAIVVAGENKREAVMAVIDPKNKENIDKYPGAILQRMKRVEIFTDL